MSLRKCFVLTCNEKSERTQFSKHLLEKIGFQVNLFQAIPNKDKVLSNKISMMQIYNIIAHGEDEWVYVFEDDINILEEVSLDEIIKYESISSHFFYLGVCDYGFIKNTLYKEKINDKNVTVVNGFIRGLHAIGISKKGAGTLFHFARMMEERYMDVCLEKFSEKFPANVMRYDLESYISRHRGLFYQDRNRFPSTI
jgi:hypothetical protein